MLSDDGFGPAVARLVRERLDTLPGALASAEAGGLAKDEGSAADDVTVEEASVAGFHLLDLLNGYDRVLLVDVVQTGRYPAGTLLDLPLQKASSARTLGGSHQMDLVTTVRLGQLAGYRLPGSITILVAEAEDLLTLGERLTPGLERAVPAMAALVWQRLARGAAEGSIDHVRVLS